MKKYYSIFIISLVLFVSCSNEDYASLVEKKEYEKAFSLSAERFNTTGDAEHLKNALFAANEYLEDAKSALPLLEKYFSENKSFLGIENLASLTFYNSALTYYRTDKYDSAIFYASKAFEIRKNYAKALLLIGKAKVRGGDMKEGYSDIKAALAIDSTLTDGYTFLGNIHFINEEFEQAVYFYRKAVSVNPLYYEGWMNLGELLMAMKKQKESADCYREALSIDSMRIDAYDRLINIFTSTNKMDSVLKYMDIYQKKTGVNLKVK
ncbi:TPA: hypothetical protein DCW38_05250 [candidate division WOR-3 bacterium]|jgi:tetratricopeptide (TPR) repeat protein|uniref:Uncharacterized protein n=1 Tax=candidate division WOR-3 bacterium TaxID=2052148 RepID=A0A350HAK5_UNCW3|nr:hypothetical protein [candidate division WOR-3 bacterium]